MCAITPSPARAAATFALRLELVQAIRHARPCASNASRARARVIPGGGYRMSGTGLSGSTRSPGAPIQIRESSQTSRPPLSVPRRLARIRSSRPAASRAWSVPESSTVSSRSTSGCSRRKDSRISGSRVVTKSSDAPNRSRPRSRVPPKNAAARSCAWRIVRAKPSIASPSSVSSTRCVSRLKSARPVASSRRRTCWLTVDWRSPSRSAARVKLSVWATARKVRSWVGSYTARGYRGT